MYALILAGGSGTRFWPQGRRKFPKFLLPLAPNGRTLLSDTAARVEPVASLAHVVVVTGVDQAAAVRHDLPHLPAANVLAEPAPRDTAAAIAFGIEMLRRRQVPESTPVAVLPADAYIRDVGRYRHALTAAAALAVRSDRIVTFGIPPTFPAIGYGYIETAARIESETAVTAFHVGRFVEKPVLAKAQEYVASKRFLWNAGQFIATIGRFQAEVATFMPELARGIRALPNPDAAGFVEAFAALPKLSIDYGVMEKTPRVEVVAAEFDWSDVGTWDAVHALQAEELALKPEDNLTHGEVIAIDSHGCFVQTDGDVVAVIGMRDVIVVRHNGAILVCPRGQSESVKRVVEALKQRGRESAT